MAPVGPGEHPDGLGALAPQAERDGVGGVAQLLGGVADAELDAVILPYYAVLFVLAIPLVLLPTGALFGLGRLPA